MCTRMRAFGEVGRPRRRCRLCEVKRCDAAVWLCGVKRCDAAVWAASPCFPVRGPWILLQNTQNPGKWPRFSLLHQVFKAEIWAASLIVVRGGTDFVGRNGCFRLRRPRGQLQAGIFHNCNRKERRVSPPLTSRFMICVIASWVKNYLVISTPLLSKNIIMAKVNCSAFLICSSTSDFETT